MKSLFFFLLLVLILPNPVFAQTTSLVVSLPPVVITPSPSVNYTMPWPGILADNPLYPLKTLRDNIIGWMIRDPLKKSKFDLLQSDKRLGGGVMLIQQDTSKTSLALSTISKGENYFGDAIVKAKDAKKQGVEIKDLIRRLSNANQKHSEILHQLDSRLTGSNKAGLQILEKRVLVFQSELVKLLSK